MELNERNRSRRRVEDTASQYEHEALSQYAAGNLAQAENLALEALRRNDGKGLQTARILCTLAAVRLDLNKHAAASEDARRAYQLTGEFATPGSDRTADELRVRSICLIARGMYLAQDLTAARPLLERALTFCHHWLAADCPETCQVLTLLGTLAKETGCRHEAEEFYRKALKLAERVWDAHSGEVAAVCHLLALLAEGWEDGDLMIPFAERAVQIRCGLFGSTHPLSAAAQTGLALALEAAHEDTRAGETFLYAMAIFDRQYATAHYGRSIHPETLRDYALCRSGAVRYLVACGRTEDAREFSGRTLQVFQEVLGKNHPRTREMAKEHKAMSKTAPRHKISGRPASAWDWWRGLSFSR